MFAVATNPKPRAARLQQLYWALGLVLLVITLFWLYKFDELSVYIVGTLPLIDLAGSTVAAALVVTCSVLSLPYLLAMRVSPLMSVLSMVCAVFASELWILLGIFNLF